MDITIAWSDGGGLQATDGWNVLYRERTSTNTNNWILATDPPLPASTNQYTITGLTQNVVYDVLVSKSCNAIFDLVSQSGFSRVTCPVVATWQGPVVNNQPTLFYSVYYEEGTDVEQIYIRAYDCTPEVYQIVNAVGNSSSITYTTGSTHNLLPNAIVTITGVSPSGYNITGKIISVTGTQFVIANSYMGTYVPSSGIVTYNPGMAGDGTPRSNYLYGKLSYQIQNAATSFNIMYFCATDVLNYVLPSNTSSVAGYFGIQPYNCGGYCQGGSVSYCDDPILLKYSTPTNPVQYKIGTFVNKLKDNDVFLFQEYCRADSVTEVTSYFTFDDDATQTYRNLNVPNYAYLSTAACFDSTEVSANITVADGTGRTNITGYNITYDVYDTSSGGPYPYLKDNGLPETSNNIQFRVFGELNYSSSFASSLTSGMDIDIKFNTNVPSTITVLSLSNVNYTGFTLSGFLTDLANKINTIGVYTAVVVPLGAGAFALRIYHSDVTILSLGLTYNSPLNPFGLVGSPLLQENYSPGEALIGSAFEYNGFIYGARGSDNIANIQVTEIATGNTIGYSHPIDFLIREIELVPVAPPTEVYDVKVLQTNTGNYPYNLAIDETNGYIYVINNNDITVYDLSNNQLDTANLATIIGSSRVYRHICVLENTGNIFLFESPAGGPASVDVIQYLSPGNWTYVNTYTYTESSPGDIKYNPVTGFIYLSIGLGQVNVFDNTGSIGVIQLQEPDTTNAVGSFQMAVDNTSGMVYMIRRDSTTLFGVTPSKHIYTIDSSGNAGVIDGSLYWNVDICGAIALDGDSLYFTERYSRTFIEFDKTTLTQLGAKNIPSVYKKLENTNNAEFTQGAYIIGPNRFVVMNYVNTTNTLGTAADYQITDLFVYDYANNAVVQSLIGGPNEPYSGLITGWNPNVDGPTFAYNNVNINYAYSLSIKIASTGKIYWKGALNTPFLVSQSYTEGGVAQIWAIQALQGSKALIRIFNIQSDGTLEVSNRLICQNYTNAIRNMRYDSHYGGVIVNSYLGSILDIWDPTNLTGYVGNTVPISYPSSTYFTSVDYLGNGTTAGLYWAQRILSNNQGGIAIFGPRYPAFTNRYGYMNFAESDIKTQSIAPTFSSTADSVNPGLYNTDSYPQMYVSATNTYWVTGRTLYYAGDEIINIYDAPNSGPLTLLHTINLTAAGVTFSGFTLMTYLPSEDTVVIYGSIGKFFININTYVGVLHNIALPVPGSGALVYTPTGNYLDYRLDSTQEAWGLLGTIPVTTTNLTYSGLSINCEDSASATANFTYDLYLGLDGPTVNATTFGQWKEITDTTWATIPPSITVSLGSKIEFTSFILDKPIVEVRNITQGTTHTSNSISGIDLITLIANNVMLTTGDVLEIEFVNPYKSDCPFINTTTITII